MKVAVYIPTANRPQYLPTALESVAAQTGVGRIGKVVVSENGGNRESERIAREFSGRLPIEYRLQSPPLGPVAHLARLFEEAEGEVLAFLCDDDWWGAGHLESSLRALEGAPGAAAAFTASLHVEGEEAWHGEIYRPAPLVAAMGGEVAPRWRELSRAQVLGAAWLCTPFHFSSMVGRVEALKRANALMKPAHPNWADRILEAGLAREGDVLYFPLPEIGVRLHAGNWRSGRKEAEMLATDREGTRRIELLAAEAGLDLEAFWRERLPSASPALRNELANRFLPLIDPARMAKSGLRAALFPSWKFAAVKYADFHFARHLRPWVPPVFLGLHRKWKRRIG